MTDTITQEIIQAKDEQISETEHSVEYWKKKYLDVVKYVSGQIMSPEDEESIHRILPKYVKSYENAESLKVELDKEVLARKSDFLAYQEKLDELKGKLSLLQGQFQTDLQVLTEKYEGRVLRLESQLEEANRRASKEKTQINLNPVYDFFRKIKL